MPDPVAEQLLHMIRGYWVSQIVGAIAALKIPDCLAKGPLHNDEIASEIGCDPQATYRLLRAAVNIGIISRIAGDRFILTSMSDKLRSNASDSLRDLAVALTGPAHWLPWGRLVEAVRSGTRQTQATLGQDLFQYYSENTTEGNTFTRAMFNSSAMIAENIADALDTSMAKDVIDVGGASGGIIAALLLKNPKLSGTILELGSVAPYAREAITALGLSSRCRVVVGDFFNAIPEADIHILKHIIHDWDDEQAIRILANSAHSLRPRGKIVLIESVLPDDDRTNYAPLADLNMLVLLPGKERTKSDYSDLFKAASLRLEEVVPIASSLQLIVGSAAE